MSTELAFVLRDLETNCRMFMREMEQAVLAGKPMIPHGPEMEKFGAILDRFQEAAQRIGEWLAAEYNVILP
jgi:hypothetical protein